MVYDMDTMMWGEKDENHVLVVGILRWIFSLHKIYLHPTEPNQEILI